ncbi:NAD(P)/FAD-dependent oxidoreductase, partial [Psychroserpens mesophilus]|uniref:NAD(P)/FAD-dependent oxidoreductase n=1 Tax=Psychroserpens mesophilus TaxID=325473 RepID=UPI003D6467C4
DLLVIGGGAAGFYGAIHAARRGPGMRIGILEQIKEFLSKVRISGGGRCNVTHRPLEPAVLAGNYPRGNKELIGPFHTHASREVMAFFESLRIPLKTEGGG